MHETVILLQSRFLFIFLKRKGVEGEISAYRRMNVFISREEGDKTFLNKNNFIFKIVQIQNF